MNTLEPCVVNFLPWAVLTDVSIFLKNWKKSHRLDSEIDAIRQFILEDGKSSSSTNLTLQEKISSFLKTSYLEDLTRKGVDYSLESRSLKQPGLKDLVLQDQDLLMLINTQIEDKAVSPFLEDYAREVIEELSKADPLYISYPIHKKDPSKLEVMVDSITKGVASKVFSTTQT